MNTLSEPLVLMGDWVSPMPPVALIGSAMEQGYDGVELWWPAKTKQQRELRAAIENSKAVVSLLAGSAEGNPAYHIAELRQKMLQIANSGLNPLHVTLHAGRDHWEDHHQDVLAEGIHGIRSETGLDVLVELHRARILYAAHASRRILIRHPELRVTFDISHWLTVAESMLSDQTGAVDLAIERSDHIHARIGHPQGPQVNDPEAERWAPVVEQHLLWWDRIVARLRNEGRPVTFLAEFGPADYAPTDPHNGRPLRDPESSNRWMQRVIRQRYSG